MARHALDVHAFLYQSKNEMPVKKISVWAIEYKIDCIDRSIHA